jgi:hypothetical protein
MVYDSSEIIVRRILPPAEAVHALREWDLEIPWREVVVRGPGLNPDPSVADPDAMAIAFGTPLGEDAVPALRRGNVLLTDFEALTTLEKPLAVLAHRTALTFLALGADRVSLKREGRLLLTGSSTGERETEEGRKLWLTEFPGSGREGLHDIDRHGLTQNLMVELERIPVLAVLPPSAERSVLEDAERVEIRVTFGVGAAARDEVFEIGRLNQEALPLEARLKLAAPVGARPTGLWSPADGRLLQIPEDVLVTARNMVQFAAPVIPE